MTTDNKPNPDDTAPDAAPPVEQEAERSPLGKFIDQSVAATAELYDAAAAEGSVPPRRGRHGDTIRRPHSGGKSRAEAGGLRTPMRHIRGRCHATDQDLKARLAKGGEHSQPSEADLEAARRTAERLRRKGSISNV